MVRKDPIGKIRDSFSDQYKDITYYSVCKELKPIEEYEKELENVSKKISEVAQEAQSSLEELLNRMKKLNYSLISRDIKREYGYLICPITEAFYYGILKGIGSAIDNNKNINNLKTALEYLVSRDNLERFFKAHLKRADEKFYKENGYTISGLVEMIYVISEFLISRDIRDRNAMSLLDIRTKNAVKYIDNFADWFLKESEVVADIVKNLVKNPEQYRKDFEEYIGYKVKK